MWFAAIAAVILLPTGIAWPLGGLEDAEKDAPPRLSLGQKVSGHLFEFTPRKAFYTTKEPNAGSGGADPGRFVVLDLDVTNVSTMPSDISSVYRDVAVKLDGHALDAIADLKDYLILREGESEGRVLNPGLPESVRLVWTVPDGARDPRKIAVAISDEEYEPSWSLLGYYSGTSLWYKADIIGTLETPLERV